MTGESRSNMRIGQLAARITLIQVLFAATVVGQAGDVDGYIQKMMTDRHIPGLSIVVSKGGKIVKSGNYGLANVRAWCFGE